MLVATEEQVRRSSNWAVICLALGAVVLVVGAVTAFMIAGARRMETRRAADIGQLRQDATSLFNHGEFPQAEAVARRLLEHLPDDPEVHLLLAETLIGQERYEAAYEHATAAVELKGDVEESHFFAGVLASRIGRWEQAHHHHAQAARLNGRTAKYPLHDATALVKLGRFDEAQAQALRALQIDAALPQAHFILAQIADERRDIEAALAALHKALTVMERDDPQRLDYMVYITQLLRRAGRAAEAVNLLTGLPPAQQLDERVVGELAKGYVAIDQPRRAAAVWAELHALEPRNARAAAETGLCLIRAGDSAQARRYLGYARAVDPRHPTVVSLARALESSREP
jgi:tetratricopeptide (TPR) repeat protein